MARRLPSLKRLYAQLKDAPANIASLEVTEAGFRVNFREQGGAAPSGPHTPAIVGSTPAPATKFVSGTPFPDDGSPIDVADLSLAKFSLEDEEAN